MTTGKILIISVSGIGNTILQSPLINFLLDQQKLKVDILFGNPSMKCVFGSDPRINSSYILPQTLPGIINLFLQLRKNRYDYSIACFPSNRPEFNLLPFLIGAKKRIIHSYEVGGLRTLSFLSNIKIKSNRSLHDVEQNLNLLKAFNADSEKIDRQLIFFNSDENETYARNLLNKYNLEGKHLVGIHPGCKIDQNYKRWPKEKFIGLINKLNQNNAYCILFTGPDELGPTEEIYSQLSDKSKNILLYEKNLNNVGALISKCHVFLSTDSGLGHIAVAKNVKTYAILGPAQPSRISPYGSYGNYITLNLDCSPCLKYPFDATRSKINCPYNFKCLHDIEIDSVYSELMDLKI